MGEKIWDDNQQAAHLLLIDEIKIPPVFGMGSLLLRVRFRLWTGEDVISSCWMNFFFCISVIHDCRLSFAFEWRNLLLILREDKTSVSLFISCTAKERIVRLVATVASFAKFSHFWRILLWILWILVTVEPYSLRVMENSQFDAEQLKDLAEAPSWVSYVVISLQIGSYVITKNNKGKNRRRERSARHETTIRRV